MKLHPVLRLLVDEPHLLADHLKAYVTLVKGELGKLSSSMLVRVGLFAGAGVFAVLGVLYLGVALLIRAAVPSDDYPAGWALFVVPLVPFVIAAVMVFVARSRPVEKAFDTVKQQLDADAQMLREATAP